MTEKRMRGRPTGTGIDDQRFLNEVADLLENDPRMKPTAAMRHVIKIRKGQWNAASEEAMMRRLQEKWKASKSVLQNQAKARAEEKRRSTTLVDLVNIGLNVAQTIKAWQTPENIALLQRAADNIAAMLDKLGEGISQVNLAKHMIIDQNTQRNLSEASRRIEEMTRVSLQFGILQDQILPKIAQDQLKLASKE